MTARKDEQTPQEMDIVFPGGKKVAAELNGHRILTDQPKEDGGEGGAPAPYELFISSLGTCAGYFILVFCQERGIPTDNIGLKLSWTRDDKSKLLDTMRITISLPRDFPQKYVPVVKRAVDKCAVKRTLFDPPQFDIEARVED